MAIQFDKQQQAVINSNASKMCVIAGAGAGKTACLTARVKRLLKEGADPSKMVCITFTNLAAQEMQSRLSDVSAAGMFIGTIHSYALRLMRTNRIKLQIATEEQENKIAEDLIRKYAKHLTLELFDEWKRMRRLKELGRATTHEVSAVLSKDQKEELEHLLDYTDISAILTDSNLTTEQKAIRAMEVESNSHVTAQYPETVRSVMNKQGLITFNGLLDLCQRSGKLPEVEYLFIDEFQDVGVFEYRFFMALNAKNIFVVGDDYQSIYGWKGADFEYFKAMTQDPNYETLKMENNYRSVKKVVDEGNRIIRSIDDVIPKNCVSKVKAIAPPTIIHSDGGVSEVMRFLSLIDPRDYGKWFVLTRSNNDAVVVSRQCYHADIPAITFKKAAMTQDEMEQAMQSNSIKILTIHTAKGLENDNVLVWGMLPHTEELVGYYGDSYEQAPTEECRIYYTAVTRAKKNLVVIHKPKYEASNFGS